MIYQFDLQNTSIDKPVNITIKYVDRKETHLDTILKPQETVNVKAKNGVKYIIVNDNSTNETIWEGYVPSFISQPLKINPHTNNITYNDHPLVNLHKESDTSTIVNIILIVCVILLILCIWLCYKRFI